VLLPRRRRAGVAHECILDSCVPSSAVLDWRLMTWPKRLLWLRASIAPDRELAGAGTVMLSPPKASSLARKIDVLRGRMVAIRAEAAAS